MLRPAPATGEGLETIGCAEAEAELAGLEQQVVAPWETVTDGPFTITAVPASDGFGDPQVSWVVEADGTRILHAGDTLFHGWWWLIGMRCGPIDVAFLPVNGAVADLPHRQPPSPLPACMDPQQAAVAASLLRARLAVPIHYGAIHSPAGATPRSTTRPAPSSARRRRRRRGARRRAGRRGHSARVISSSLRTVFQLRSVPVLGRCLLSALASGDSIIASP